MACSKTHDGGSYPPNALPYASALPPPAPVLPNFLLSSSTLSLNRLQRSISQHINSINCSVPFHPAASRSSYWIHLIYLSETWSTPALVISKRLYLSRPAPSRLARSADAPPSPKPTEAWSLLYQLPLVAALDSLLLSPRTCSTVGTSRVTISLVTHLELTLFHRPKNRAASSASTSTNYGLPPPKPSRPIRTVDMCVVEVFTELYSDNTERSREQIRTLCDRGEFGRPCNHVRYVERAPRRVVAAEPTRVLQVRPYAKPVTSTPPPPPPPPQRTTSTKKRSSGMYLTRGMKFEVNLDVPFLGRKKDRHSKKRAEEVRVIHHSRTDHDQAPPVPPPVPSPPGLGLHFEDDASFHGESHSASYYHGRSWHVETSIMHSSPPPSPVRVIEVAPSGRVDLPSPPPSPRYLTQDEDVRRRIEDEQRRRWRAEEEQHRADEARRQAEEDRRQAAVELQRVRDSLERERTRAEALEAARREQANDRIRRVRFEADDRDDRRQSGGRQEFRQHRRESAQPARHPVVLHHDLERPSGDLSGRPRDSGRHRRGESMEEHGERVLHAARQRWDEREGRSQRLDERRRSPEGAGERIRRRDTANHGPDWDERLRRRRWA